MFSQVGYLWSELQYKTTVRPVTAAGSGYLNLVQGETVIVQYVGAPASDDDGWLYGASWRDEAWTQGWFSVDAVYIPTSSDAGGARHAGSSRSLCMETEFEVLICEQHFSNLFMVSCRTRECSRILALSEPSTLLQCSFSRIRTRHWRG